MQPNPVRRLCAALGPRWASIVITEALAERSTEPTIDPQAWRTDGPQALTADQIGLLSATAARCETLAGLPISLDAAQIARHALSADTLMLTDVEDYATIMGWLAGGAVLVDPSHPLPPHLAAFADEDALQLDPRGLCVEVRLRAGGWSCLWLVATVHDNRGREIGWLVAESWAGDSEVAA